MKRFASIWLPAFAIDRMRRQQPGLVPQDKPAVLVESGPRGIVVTAVNGPAARGSIQPGQMLADVRAVLPGLLTHLAQPGRDRRALHQLALWLGRYGPSRNTEGNDGLWVETTGAAHLFGGEEALARDCIERLRRVGLQASVAIADTRSAAFALARYGLSGKQFVIAPKGDTRAALADLPVEGLQLTGDLVILLRRLGLKRIGQLYGLPRAALARRFREAAPRGGSNRRHSRGLMRQSRHAGWAEALVMRLDQALGELGEPARGMIEPPVHRFHRAYAEPLISHEGILAALDELAKRLCAALMERDEGARMLRFTICRADGSAADVLVRTIRPASEPQHVAELFRMRMERMDAGFGIDAIVLEALKTQRLEHEQESLAGARGAGGGPGDRRDPGELVDRLVNR
ncbi:MAG: DNA polymerase Y family protein, partial [Alphaproteobacteria bacterium]|nr:DNA polymerase Y family protein [Alphaproteobacteria bacterium]